MTGRLATVAYVGVVAGLTAYAFSSDHEEHWTAEIAAGVLALPLLVVALPAVYVLGGLAWHGPMWVVTATFTVMMATTALGNVVLVRAAAGALARTRWGSSRARARPARASATRRRRG